MFILVYLVGSTSCLFLYITFCFILSCVTGRFYAFDRAHSVDPASTYRGVRQFKTALLHKLEKVRLPMNHKLAQKPLFIQEFDIFHQSTG